ncbi:tRNA 2-selenouridine(34) synthase MnmH [Propionivibrio sp.]|uniref:tRNA 2-selenouridine(34) synthase MnmH n=1 Tax=Propionivibrio sp. TaxID=2212460 RepID=UPI002618A5B7|nr:tRNA 2-selenouridine(34) synthase MnmH [Propionivibrio sp.]
MRHGVASVGQIEDYHLFEEIIDVRTPAEFADDHIPGAINCPVLDNTQRIEVGTLYNQVSPFAAKKIGAAYVSENIARHLRETFHDRPKTWRPLIVCWRGGQRSGAMTYVLRRIGWDAQQLEGGYKSYRKQVIDKLARLPHLLHFKVVCGATGSGKSRLLHALAQRSEQVLDLEELACHKGSVLGVLPDSAQPSQKTFESNLLAALQGLDPTRPVYVEAESRRIGSIQLPDALLARLREGECINIEARFEARVDFLLRDYAYFLNAPDWFNSRLDVLHTLQSRETINRWQGYAKIAQWRTLVIELLELHYDPLYRRSQNRNFNGFGSPETFTTSDLSAAGIDLLAARIAAKIAASPTTERTP